MNRGLLECLIRIRNLNEFSEFRALLEAEKQIALNVLTGNQDATKLYAAQGAYNQIQRLQDLIEKAPTLLDKQRG
jgi:hypothetical protein